MDDRVLILAPRGRDAAIAADLLGRNDIVAFVCRDQADLLAELAKGAAAVMLTEEALTTEEIAPLAEWVAAQPNWADIQFVVLANGTRTPPYRARDAAARRSRQRLAARTAAACRGDDRRDPFGDHGTAPAI